MPGLVVSVVLDPGAQAEILVIVPFRFSCLLSCMLVFFSGRSFVHGNKQLPGTLSFHPIHGKRASLPHTPHTIPMTAFAWSPSSVPELISVYTWMTFLGWPTLVHVSKLFLLARGTGLWVEMVSSFLTSAVGNRRLSPRKIRTCFQKRE